MDTRLEVDAADDVDGNSDDIWSSFRALDGDTEIDVVVTDGLMIFDELGKESTTSLAAITIAAFDSFSLRSMEVGELESIVCVVVAEGVVRFMEGNATFLVPVFRVALIFV